MWTYLKIYVGYFLRKYNIYIHIYMLFCKMMVESCALTFMTSTKPVPRMIFLCHTLGSWLTMKGAWIIRYHHIITSLITMQSRGICQASLLLSTLVSICVCISVAIWKRYLDDFAYLVLATTHTSDGPSCTILWAKAWPSCEDHQTKWNCRKICNLQICCLSMFMIL